MYVAANVQIKCSFQYALERLNTETDSQCDHNVISICLQTLLSSISIVIFKIIKIVCFIEPKTHFHIGNKCQRLIFSILLNHKKVWVNRAKEEIERKCKQNNSLDIDMVQVQLTQIASCNPSRLKCTWNCENKTFQLEIFQ